MVCQGEWPTLILTTFNSFSIKRTFQVNPHTASYQRLSSRTYREIIATHTPPVLTFENGLSTLHRYSPLKTGKSYHALILTSHYATPTSYIHNSVLYFFVFSFRRRRHVTNQCISVMQPHQEHSNKNGRKSDSDSS